MAEGAVAAAASVAKAGLHKNQEPHKEEWSCMEMFQSKTL